MPQHGLAEHLDQPAVGVPGEPLVVRLRGQAVHRLVVEADVEDGLHHPGHRELRPGAHRHEQRVVRVAELAAHRRPRASPGARSTSSASPSGLVARLQVGPARLGGDGEPGRDRQAEVGHLGQVGALAAEQVLQVLVALGEVVDVRAGRLLGIHDGIHRGHLRSPLAPARRGARVWGRRPGWIGRAGRCVHCDRPAEPDGHPAPGSPASSSAPRYRCGAGPGTSAAARGTTAPRPVSAHTRAGADPGATTIDSLGPASAAASTSSATPALLT